MNHRNHPNDGSGRPIDRRGALKIGAGLAVAPVLSNMAMAQPVERAAAQQPARTPASASGPRTVRAYAAHRADRPLEPLSIPRREPEEHDVVIDILYCGVCHSDIHQAPDEWAEWGPTVYPCVPGHEIIGRVSSVGKKVTKFKEGDLAGVGCMVDSCRACEHCRADHEQNCTRGATFTYNAPDKHGTAPVTYGGYSDRVVVTEHFVIRIPPGADLAATAPLLCAGITTSSRMQHWRLKEGQRVGVIGLGGLGHMAVQLAAARGAEVTVFTTTAGKVEDAKRLGAKQAVLSTDADAMKPLASSLDLIIATAPRAFPMKPFINCLKREATLVNVGAMEQIEGVTGIDLVYARRSIAGSMIGGIAETQEVIDYCYARGIKPQVEVIPIQEINKAFERVVNKDVRYRFVIDMQSLRG